MGILEKIKDIELEMARTQRNKATSRHLGLLKGKLAMLRAQLLEPAAGSAGAAGGDDGFSVQKQGDARVVFIGFPSVGKSTLLNKLSGSDHSATAAYEFTTLCLVPGQVHYNGANIQLCDLPGIIEGAAKGKGRGRQVIAVARTADLVLMVLDANKGYEQVRLLEAELEEVGIRLNKRKPDIYFKPKKTGGLKINNTVPLTQLDEPLIRGILHDYRIHNAELLFREDVSVDDFIDVLIGRCVYLPCLYAWNKIDTIPIDEVDWLARRPNSAVISAEQQLNFPFLMARIWDMLKLVRIYTKKRGEPPDLSEPLILRGGGHTIEAFCNHLHRDMVREFKCAYVWGSSTKHNPQRCGLPHVLHDEDVLMIVKKQGKNS